jgi:hemolysin III
MVGETGEASSYRRSVRSTQPSTGRTKPVFRGLLHELAFYLAIPAGVTIGLLADGSKDHVAAAVFAGTVVAMFGASALYHRPDWSPGVRRWLRRIDYVGIFGLIAGTYTALGLLALQGASRIVVLSIVWAGAAVAIVAKFVWPSAPKWLSAAIGIVLGWVGVSVFPQLIDRAGLTPSMLLVGGGCAYTLGAVIYARRRPDPFPAVFGYHELFHALVVAAVGLQYAAVGSLVLR